MKILIIIVSILKILFPQKIRKFSVKKWYIKDKGNKDLKISFWSTKKIS